MGSPRKVYFVSDRTGVSVETLGLTLLTMFNELEFETITVPFVDSTVKAHDVVRMINESANESPLRPLVFSSLFDAEIDQIVSRCSARTISPFRPMMEILESEFGGKSVPVERPYDVSISFAGEDREIAESIADALVQKNMTVFYDAYEKANLLGKDLHHFLFDVYSRRSTFCVLLISKHYMNKKWTKHELKAMQAAAMASDQEYILPIRLDDADVPGLAPQLGYLNWRDESAESVANLINQKLGALTDRLQFS